MTFPVIESAQGLAVFVNALRAGSGPIAIDAERASGFRYGQRAYLIQVHREGSGLGLIDPIAVPDLADLADAIAPHEWILHAATQDLPCLHELDLHPRRLFDTELAGRLLGFERVNLAALVEQELSITLRKGHGATDWSKRPLSPAQLEYAALDVAHLIALRERMHQALVDAGKWLIAEQEFEALLQFQPKPAQAEPWRRLSGLHELKQPEQLALARELWIARDERARVLDLAPGRVLADRHIITLSRERPADQATMAAIIGADDPWWWEALERGRATHDLPQRRPADPQLAPPRQWARKYPAAFARWESARAAILDAAADLGMPVENLLAPALVRMIAWDPPDDIASALDDAGARRWQIEVAAPILAQACHSAAAQVTDE
jgi:ribonuclease D